MKVIVQDFSRDLLRPLHRVCEFRGRVQGSGPLKGWHQVDELTVLSEKSSDLQGLPVLHSGFVDAHVHLSWIGEQNASMQSPTFSTVAELAGAIRQRFQNGTQLVESAYSYEETLWGGTTLVAVAAAMAGIPAQYPWILFRVCGHRALVSAEVLRRSKLDIDAAKCQWLDSERIFQLYRWLEQERLPRIPTYVLRAQDDLLRVGYSGVSDMAWDVGKAQAVIGLHKNEKLMLDVVGVLHGGMAGVFEQDGPFWLEAERPHPIMKTRPVVTCRHWKKFLDGSFGARTAWLTEAYSDAPNEFGRDLGEIRQLLTEAETALGKGFHLSFHAIGDAAIDRIIEMQEMLQNLLSSRRRLSLQSGLPAVWHRIEHGQLIRDSQIEALAESKNWMICAQPFHRVMDLPFIHHRLGADRLLNAAYRAGSLIAAGIPLAMSSDGPIGSISPEAVLKAVTEDPREQERVPFAELIWLYTRGSRSFLGLPDRTPTVGSYAWLSEC